MFRKGLIFYFSPLLLSWLAAQLLIRYTPFETGDWKFLLVFYAVVTALFYITYNLTAPARNFAQVLLVCVVLRLLSCMAFILVLAAAQGKAVYHTAIHFLVYFVIFTIFDLLYLFSFLKKKPLQSDAHHEKNQT